MCSVYLNEMKNKIMNKMKTCNCLKSKTFSTQKMKNKKYIQFNHRDIVNINKPLKN